MVNMLVCILIGTLRLRRADARQRSVADGRELRVSVRRAVLGHFHFGGHALAVDCATEMGTLTSFLPAFLLSGFIYSIDDMPRVIQAISLIVPARYSSTS